MSEKLQNMITCNVYSRNKDTVSPLMSLYVKPNEIVRAIKSGDFPMEEVNQFFTRAAKAVQEAIKEGKA